MPMTTYPLNDVEYNAEAAELFHCTRTSGIFAEGHFSISATGYDNVLEIGKGIAWIKNTEFSGKVVAQKESVSVDAGISDASLPRIDAVAIRFDANSNSTNIVVKKGTPSSSPVPPNVEREEYAYELHLYHIRRRAGATSISSADISDLRLNADYCGLMADSVTKVDTAAIEAQIKGLTNRLDAAIAQTQGGAGFVSKTLLWENVSPDEGFTDRWIDVPINNYDAIEIICYSPYIMSTGIIPLGESRDTLVSTVGGSPDKLYRASRNFSLFPSQNGIAVGYGYFDELNTPNRSYQPLAVVPIKIYGYTGTIDPNVELPPSAPIPTMQDMIFDLDVDMHTSGRLMFTNNEQMQKVYNNNMSIYVVYHTEASGLHHVFRCVCPSVRDSLPIQTASGGAIVFAGGAYNNPNVNARYNITIYFDSDKFAADETTAVTGGSFIAIPTGVTADRVYASIF